MDLLLVDQFAGEAFGESADPARTAFWLTTYGVTWGELTRPQTEDMLIRTPLPWARKRRSAERAPWTCPIRLVSTIPRKTSEGISSKGP